MPNITYRTNRHVFVKSQRNIIYSFLALLRCAHPFREVKVEIDCWDLQIVLQATGNDMYIV